MDGYFYLILLNILEGYGDVLKSYLFRILFTATLLGVVVFANAAETPFSIDLGADGHDLEYDSSRNVIYASVPSLNEVAVIDVATLQTQKTILLNAEPRGLDLSLDNSKLYIAMSGSGSVGIVDLATDTISYVFVEQLGDLRAWDVEETHANRIFVSANPGSSGLSYIVEILIDAAGDLLSEQRVAGGGVFRSEPVFSVSPDAKSLYFGNNGNSLIVLDLQQANAPIIYNSTPSYDVEGLDQLVLSPDGSRLHTTWDEIIRTDTFVHASRTNDRGLVAYGQSSDHYFLADRSSIGFLGMTNINYYDSQKYKNLGSFTIPCTAFGNSLVDFLILSNDEIFLTLNDNLVCGVTTDVVSLDSDGDSVRDFVDNCDDISNTGQSDSDGDQFGDVCDAFPNDASNNLPFDPDQNQLTLTNGIQDFIYDSVGNVFYASIPDLNEVHVINATTYQIQKRIVVGSSPRGLDLSVDNSKLYVALLGGTGFAIVDLLTNQVSEIVTEQLGDSRTWDVIETDPNRFFVSASPGSSSFSYIVEVILDANGDIISQQRVADGNIIRSGPTFALSPDGNFLYIGEGDNSLYKLDLNQPNVPIVLEDPPIIGNYFEQANNFILSPDGSRIHTPRGHVIDASTLLVVSQLPVGPVTYSISGEYFLVAESSTFMNENTEVNIYDSSTSQLIGTFELMCTGDTGAFFNNNIITIKSDDALVILSQGVGDSGVICRSASSVIADTDNDSILDVNDNCPAIQNSNQLNTDGDAFGDVCDPYPNDPNNIPSALELFPLKSNTVFHYLVDGSVPESEIVLADTRNVQGIDAIGILDSDSSISYYTNDENGLREHLLVDTVGDTLTLIPPAQTLNSVLSLGEEINSTGVAQFNIDGIGLLDIPYIANSTVVGFETISVPYGTFDAIRVDTQLIISGASNGFVVSILTTGSSWYVKDLGEIRSVITTDGVTRTTELTSVQFPINVASSILPVSRSSLIGQPTTVFASIANSTLSMDTAVGCAISPSTFVPAAFSFQATDSMNNTIGAANSPVDIPVGAAQNFILSFTPSASFAPEDIQFDFSCTNSNSALNTTGLNTLLLSASVTPMPDVVGLTTVVDLQATVGNTSLFAVGSSNIGASGDITVSVDDGGQNLPVVLNVCQTDLTGACSGPIDPTVTLNYVENTTASFAIFVQPTGEISNNPSSNRIFIRFKDNLGIPRGATSSAVRTR